jgi:hypothetical protein
VAELICPSCGAVGTGETPLCPTCILPFVPRRPDSDPAADTAATSAGADGVAPAGHVHSGDVHSGDVRSGHVRSGDVHSVQVGDARAVAVHSEAGAGRSGPAPVAYLAFPWGEVEVTAGLPLVVGREGSTLARRLADYPNVSRRHAEIALADGRLTVEDLNSVNGTFVNDERVPALRPRPLVDGDELRFAAVLRATVRSAGHRGGSRRAARA